MSVVFMSSVLMVWHCVSRDILFYIAPLGVCGSVYPASKRFRQWNEGWTSYETTLDDVSPDASPSLFPWDEFFI